MIPSPRSVSTKLIEIPVKLFVGRLPRDMTEDQLRCIFSPFGEVKECKILCDYVTKESKGCAFVIYSNLVNAVESIQELNNQYIVDESVGDPLQVQLASGEMERLGLSPDQIDPPPTKVFVGSIPPSIKNLREMFEAYGEVVETFIISNSESISRRNSHLGSVCIQFSYFFILNRAL
jgi:RNA recognition motif-containing protein